MPFNLKTDNTPTTTNHNGNEMYNIITDFHTDTNIADIIKQRVEKVFDGKTKALNSYNAILTYIAAEVIVAMIEKGNVLLSGSTATQINRNINANFNNLTVNGTHTGIIPDQSTHSGKFLTTDGTTLSWGTGTTTNIKYAQFTNENDLEYYASQGGFGSDLDGGGSHTNSKLIKFDTTEYINPSNIITNDNGSNGSTFTVNISGKYLISASIKVTHYSNLGQNLEVYLTQQDTNGNIIKSRTVGEVNFWPAGPTSESNASDPNLNNYMAYRVHSMSNSIILDFSANDTIQLYVRMNDRGDSSKIIDLEAGDANLNFVYLS